MEMLCRLLIFFWLSIPCYPIQQDFVQCMSILSSPGYVKYIHPPTSPSYYLLLESAEQNPRWLNSTSAKPAFIVTPYTEAQIQAAVVCSNKYGLQIRVVSGGHDYEGLSYRCEFPFIVINLVNLRSISVDLEDEIAWVQSGATVGELYYSIARYSKVLGFPAGICPTVGVGGHFSGGGIGTMVRKYGLAADNILDAYFVDVNGTLLDRESMGEDLFWAIRGGGGASFGIITAWKIKLVQVPPTVTVFTVHKKMNEEAIKLINIWEEIGNKVEQDLFIRLILQKSNEDTNKEQNLAEVLFNSLFLGPIEKLMPLMNTSFPELGLKLEDCREMSWIDSVLYFQGFKSGDSYEVLLDRIVQDKGFFKAKSDFVEKPVPASVWKRVGEMIMEEDSKGILILDPFGGKMEDIPESYLPFPHRKGNLYTIQYYVRWLADGEDESARHVNWIRKLYDYMEPYVSKMPRSSYFNYRDLDIGINDLKFSYSKATLWGTKYFKWNFERLARVKQQVDPGNYFRGEQNIPPLCSQEKLKVLFQRQSKLNVLFQRQCVTIYIMEDYQLQILHHCECLQNSMFKHNHANLSVKQVLDKMFY